MFTISDATLFHSESGLTVSVAFHCYSEQGPTRNQRPRAKLLAYSHTISEYLKQVSSFGLFPQLVSFNIYINLFFQDFFWCTIQFSHPLLDSSEDLQ